MEPKKPFEHIVREHGPTVLRVCRAVLGLDDADDAWSETFLSALKAYPELPAGANMEAWLVTVAHRKSIDIIRMRGRRPIAMEVLPAVPSTLGIPLDGRRELLDAVGQLPQRQREAVAYHHLAGLPYKDIAELIGVTPEAARRAASDGIRGLRRRLTQEPLEGGTP